MRHPFSPTLWRRSDVRKAREILQLLGPLQRRTQRRAPESRRTSVRGAMLCRVSRPTRRGFADILSQDTVHATLPSIAGAAEVCNYLRAVPNRHKHLLVVRLWPSSEGPQRHHGSKLPAGQWLRVGIGFGRGNDSGVLRARRHANDALMGSFRHSA